MIYLQLFLEFFKIGLFTFGGGYAMIPLIEETVIKYGWIDESAFYEFIGICESTPGPIAVNMATFIGSQEGGFLGALCATLGVVLPSFIIILLIASILKKLIKNQHFQNFLSGVKPIIVGLIISTGIILLTKCLIATYKPLDLNIRNIIIFVGITSIYLTSKYLLKKKLNTTPLLLTSAFLGIVLYTL